MSLVDEMKKLQELHEAGALSAEEFESRKKQLLGHAVVVGASGASAEPQAMSDQAEQPDEAPEPIEVGESAGGEFLGVVIGVFLFMVLGTVALVAIMNANDENPKVAAEAAAVDVKRTESKRAATIDSKMTTLGNFTVVLRDSRSMKLQMEIQVESDLETAAMVEERGPQLRDSVILLASDYSDAELDGIDGKLRLRDEIQARINAVLSPSRIDRVYFTQFSIGGGG